MKKQHYCSCGTNFDIAPGQEVACPECGKLARLAATPTDEPSLVTDWTTPEDGAGLQELPPKVVDEFVEEDAPGDYVLDAKDGRANLRGAFWASIDATATPKRADAIASAGPWILVSQANDVQVLSAKNLEPVRRFRKHDADVTSVALSHDGALAVSGDANGDICCWDPANGERIKRFGAHEDAVLALAVSPCAKCLVSGGDDGCVRQWRSADGKYYELDKSEWDESPVFVSYSTDGFKILAGGDKGFISLWAAKSCKRLQRYTEARRPIACVRLSGDGSTIIAAARPADTASIGHPQFWRWDTTGDLKPAFKPPRRANAVPVCSFLDHAGCRLIVGGRYPLVDYRKFNPLDSTVEFNLLKQLTETKQQYSLEVWSLDSGVMMHHYTDVRGVPALLAITPDSTRIVAAMENNALQTFGMPPG